MTFEDVHVIDAKTQEKVASFASVELEELRDLENHLLGFDGVGSGFEADDLYEFMRANEPDKMWLLECYGLKTFALIRNPEDTDDVEIAYRLGGVHEFD